MALPALEAMTPVARAAGAVNAPLRMGFVYIPNGVIMDAWRPEGKGRNFSLNQTMKPLAPVKKDIQIITGLAHKKAYANGDGGGDHARANSTFLTGVQLKKTAGADIRAGISVDQVAANAIGKETRLPSLELSCDAIRKSGKCDSGYSCAYQYNLAWANHNTPVTPEIDPRLVFERLFNESAGTATERRRRTSVLDFVMDDAERLHRRLGRADQHKLDEYMQGIRDLERRIQRAEDVVGTMPGSRKPEGIPDDFGEYLRLMFDLQVLAFKTDNTRICTFLMSHDGSNRSFRNIGVPEGHHGLSHHRNDEKKMEKIRKIDGFYMEQVAYFLRKLKDTKEGAGSLLDNCMLVIGSGHSDANRHSHADLPVILAGGGGGRLDQGRHVYFDPKEKIPMTNFYLTLLDKMGVRQKELGDSTGLLAGI